MDRTLPSSGTVKGNFSETLTSAEFTGGLPEFFVSRTGLDNATQEPVATAICSEDPALPASGTLTGNFSGAVTSVDHESWGGVPEFFVSGTGLPHSAPREPVAIAICSEDPTLPTSGTAVGISGVFEIFSLSVGFPELAIAAFVPLLLSGKNGGSILSEVLGVLQDIYRRTER